MGRSSRTGRFKLSIPVIELVVYDRVSTECVVERKVLFVH